MKDIGAKQSKFGNEAFKGWLIGAGCGVLLTFSIAFSSGRVVLTQSHNTQPVVVAQQPAVISGEGAVPPPIDELQRYQLFQQASLTSNGLVPPAVDEIQQLHHLASPDEIGAGRPSPPVSGESRY